MTHSKRINISSGTSWEEKFGYSRAVRVGNVVEVAGTTAMDGDTLVGKGNISEQTRFIFRKIEKALHDAGAKMEHVVRTRMYVTDINLWQEATIVHGEVFRIIKPAATLVAVNSLVDPDLLIEIEVTAVIP